MTEIEFSNAFLLKQYTKNVKLKEKCDSVINRLAITDYKSDSDTDLFEYITQTLFNIDSDITDDLLYLLGKKTKEIPKQS